MTESWARWLTWVSGCRIKRWPIFFAAITFRRPQAEADHQLERLYPCSHGRIGSDRLFHGGSADAARLDDLLRAVFHTFGEPEGVGCKASRIVSCCCDSSSLAMIADSTAAG